MINTNPKIQTKLYGLNLQLDSLIRLFNKNLLSNKILLSGPKGIGKCTLAYHFINYIFSKNEEDKYNLKDNFINANNRSFKLLKNRSHPNIYSIDLIDDKKNIEISQIREMISYANKSSFNNKVRFVLIDGVENLNLNSSNALLKIIEEPNTNLFFFLIHDSRKNILNTIKSRCITYNLNLSFKESINIANSLLNENINLFINEDIINYYVTPGEIINLYNFSENNHIDLKKISLKEFILLLINDNYYTKDKFIKYYIFILIQNYFLQLIYKSSSKNKIHNLYNKFIMMSYNCIKYNLNYENLFLEFKYKVLNE
tara:strand:- start:1474 stop:2415 length:942 start_codon:yes stop_codon:yes gene_type:complete